MFSILLLMAAGMLFYRLAEMEGRSGMFWAALAVLGCMFVPLPWWIGMPGWMLALYTAMLLLNMGGRSVNRRQFAGRPPRAPRPDPVRPARSIREPLPPRKEPPM